MKRFIIILFLVGFTGAVEAEEQPVSLEKPIILESNETFDGEGRTYESCGHPAFIMRGTGTLLEHVTIEQCAGEEVPAIQVSGLGHQILDISIQASGVGIQVEDSYGVRILRTNIEGDGTKEGVALFNSEAAELKGVVVENVRDGIYIEQGSHHTLIRPVVSHSRYGIHLMFPTDVTISFPQLHHNGTGAMIMGTDQVVFKNGQVHDQIGGTAMGLMLYEAVGTTIDMTEIRGNRIGIYAEQSEWTTLQRNDINGNQIGLRFKQANDMTILQNNMMGNRYPVTMFESANNVVQANVWGGRTLDVDGDGLSEIPFRADPYLFTLTDTYEAFELLYGSPGLVMLETILRSPDDVSLTDEAPRISESRWEWNGSIKQGAILLVILLIWNFGRKQNEIL